MGCGIGGERMREPLKAQIPGGARGTERVHEHRLFKPEYAGVVARQPTLIGHDSDTFSGSGRGAGAPGIEPGAFGFGELRVPLFPSEQQTLEMAGVGRKEANSSRFRHVGM